MQGSRQKAFTQSPVEVAFALPQLSYVPPSSSESSGAQHGARYAVGARVLLENVASFWQAVQMPALTSTPPSGLWALI